MARPLRISYEGALYHVINRGHRREAIFTCDDDRREFLSRLGFCLKKFSVTLHGWCLMDNHYHLLIETATGNISAFMHAFQSSYANWFRVKQRLVGSIFQSRYKAVLIENIHYLVAVSAYIHLNPVRAGISEKPEDYAWSSFAHFIGKIDDKITTTARILEDSGGIENYRHIVAHGVADPEKIYGTNSIVGGELFYADMREKILRGLPDITAVQEAKKLVKSDAAAVISAVSKRYKLKKSELLKKHSHTEARKVCLYLLKHETTMMIKAIAQMAGISRVGLSSYFTRNEKAIEKNRKMISEIEAIRGVLHGKYIQ